MKDFYHGYTALSCEKGRAFFAGANTGRGFVGSYRALFPEGERLQRIYIIKGGAGTGKSTLMKKAAATAEKQGFPVEYYYCGSDPDSLDAVALDGRIVVADGTSPHTLDMKYPGACSSMIDVSRFWDEKALEEQRDSIIAYSERKAERYRAAYQYLRAAEILERELSKTVADALKMEKIRAWAERTAKKLCVGEARKALSNNPSSKSVYVGAITMKGLFSFDSYAKDAKHIYRICDRYGGSSFLLDALTRAFSARGMSSVRACAPINDKICGLYLPDIECWFTTEAPSENEEETTVNMRRFIDRETLASTKGRIRLALQCAESMLTEAASLLKEAGEQHFALEKIYSSSMDFRSLNRYENQILAEISGKLTTG